MQINDLNKIIGRALSACKGVTGAARDLLRDAIGLLNRARACLRAGDIAVARLYIAHAMDRVIAAREVKAAAQ